LFEKREKENRKLAEKQLERWTSRKEGEGKQKRKSKPNLNWVAQNNGTKPQSQTGAETN